MKIKQIGNVQVDSGLLQIGDPCYFVENLDLSPVSGEDQERETWNKNAAREIVRLSVAELNNKTTSLSMPFPETKETVNAAGEPGLGVVCNGFGGDGLFPVYGVFGSSTHSHLLTGIFVDFRHEAVLFAEENKATFENAATGETLPSVSICSLPDPDLSL